MQNGNRGGAVSQREGGRTSHDSSPASGAGAGPGAGAGGADQGYELRYFARKHGLTTAQAMDLIRRIGNNRARLNEAAVKLKRTGRAF